MTETETLDLNAKGRDCAEILSGFIEILREENAALEVYDVDKVRSLYRAKDKIVSAYRAHVAFFIKNKDGLERMDAALRAKMREMSAALEGLVKRNEILLKTKIQTSETIMNAIVSAAKMANNINATAYSAGGRYGAVDPRRAAMAVNGTF